MWETVLRMLGWKQTSRLVTAEEPAFDALPIEGAADASPVAPPQLKVVGGSHNLQVGHAGGDVVSQVNNHTHSHTHHHVTVIQAPAQAPANEPQVSASRKPSSTEHAAVLRRMEQLRDRVAVLDFMERAFGTRMVINLQAEQLFRLNRYLDVVLREARNAKTHRSRATSKA